MKIEELFKENLNSCNSEKLNKFIEKIGECIAFGGYSEEIGEKLSDAKSQLRISLEKEKLDEICQDKRDIQDEIKELANIKRKREKELRTNRENILEHLDIEENSVFLIDDLNEEEIKILKEEGFIKINEYEIRF